MYRMVENDLKQWKINKAHKPLLVLGARQVGKTYTISKFAKENFGKFIYINFEFNKKYSEWFFVSLDVNKIKDYIENEFNTLIDNDTLIFFDEIQVCQEAITSLKYFYEFLPEINIISAGSLLGVALNNNKISFPVGKVEIFNMYPLNFYEFLLANNKSLLVNKIEEAFANKQQLDVIYHNDALELYQKYLILGGMPEVINTYLEKNNYIDSIKLIDNIYENYLHDMNKYTSKNESLKIINCYNSILKQLMKENKNFKYSIIEKGKNKQYFGNSLLWLLKANVAYESKLVNFCRHPISYHTDDYIFRIYLSDMGIFTKQSKIQINSLLNPLYRDDISGIWHENYVACEFKSFDLDLFYWKGKQESEIEFLVEIDNSIIPIDVKSGKNNYSKSVEYFLKVYPKTPYTISISPKNFIFTDNKVNIPLYAVFCLAKEIQLNRFKGL